jgi:hypothetical protein
MKKKILMATSAVAHMAVMPIVLLQIVSNVINNGKSWNPYDSDFFFYPDKKMKQYFLFLAMVVLAVACKEKNANPVEENILLTDYSSKSKIKLSEFVCDIAVIPLETSDDCLVGETSKVLFFDGKVYILDMRSNAVFVYDLSGKFINKLDRTGQGAGEYIRLTDVAVNENGIYALDISTHKIKHYRFNLDFIEDVKFETPGSNFIPDSRGFWLYNEPTKLHDDCQIARINEKGIILEKFFRRNTLPNLSYNHASSNVFQKNDTALYFSPRYDNVIYEYNGDEWTPRFRISFKGKTYSDKKNISDEDIDGNDFIFRRNFYMLDNYIVHDYIINNLRYFSFYNKDTRRIVSGSVDNDMIPDYDRFFPRWSDGNILIESIESEYVLEYFPGLMNTGGLKNLHPDDNPVLILYTFKPPDNKSESTEPSPANTDTTK